MIRSTTLAACITLITAFGCADSRASNTATNQASGPLQAYAPIYDQDGELVAQAELAPIDGGVTITLTNIALPPGSHGFHIHETGDCEAADFSSAGGHFNPKGHDHGLSNADGAHMGDLPNIMIEASGDSVELYADGVSLELDEDHSLLAGDGTALVVHADPDDHVSDPAGNAGPRIACGVIGFSKS